MSLAYLTTCFPTAVETFVLREVVGLKALGLPLEAVLSLRPSPLPSPENVTVLAPGRVAQQLMALLRAMGSPLRLTRLVGLAIRLDRRSVFCLRQGHSSIIKSLLLLPAMLELDRRLSPRVSHFHAQFAGVATTTAALMAAWRGGTFSFTAHGSDLLLYPPKDLLIRLERCSFCVTVSEYNRRHILGQSAGEWAEKVRVIRCGIAVEEFQPPAPRQLGDIPHLLTVARLDPVKGLDVFLSALGLYRRQGGLPLHYLILGDGPERVRLESLVLEEGLSDWVRLGGLATMDQVREALQGADLFVLPSRSEGFPVVLMEAAAARLPLLASRITGIPEILQDGVNGRYLEPDQVEQQCKALHHLAQDNWHDLRACTHGAAQLDLREFDQTTTLKSLAQELWTVISH